MFENIGKKIKMLAQVMCGIEMIAAIVSGIVLISENDEGLGFALLLAGPLVAWIMSWFLYGFGELVDKVCDVEGYLRKGAGTTAPKRTNPGQRVTDELKKYKELKDQGVLTEEEFQAKKEQLLKLL